MKQDKNPWKTLKKNTVYEGKFGYKLREDDVITPGGTKSTYIVLERDGYAVIVPITRDNKLLLVRQWRYPVEEESLELPAGHIEKGDTPLDAAKRELKEEAKVVSNEWIELGTHWAANSILKVKGHLFLALNCKTITYDFSEDGEALTLAQVPFEDAVQMVIEGKFQDIRTQAGILLAAEYLRRKSQ